MSEPKEAQTQMVELSKPGNADETILIDPNVDPDNQDIPRWAQSIVQKKHQMEKESQEEVTFQEAYQKVRQEDLKEKQSQDWTDH